jgi:hypothetical protein
VQGVDPRISGRRTRSDTVTNWWGSLRERDAEVPPATRLLPVSLVVAAGAVSGSMPLAWHHLHVPAQIYSGPATTVVITGMDTATWLLVVAVIALALATRTYVAAPASVVKWTLIVLAFATVTGMIIDYFDWSLRGVSLYVKPYYGPGFFLALGGAALTVLAAAIAWRVPD